MTTNYIVRKLCLVSHFRHDSGSSLMLIEGESEWDRVVVEDVDSEEGSEERDGNGMVEFARIDSDCSQLLNVTPSFGYIEFYWDPC